MLNAVCPAHNSPLIFLNLTSRKRICHNCAVSGTNINLAQIRKMFNTLIEEEKLPQEVLELLKPAIRELKKYLGC
jgi:plasmid rolling circle replication initiator protein Rep